MPGPQRPFPQSRAARQVAPVATPGDVITSLSGSVTNCSAGAAPLTIAVSLVLLLVPVYSTVKISNDGPDQVTASTLLEIVGPYIFVPLLIPVALTGLPLLLTAPARNYLSVATTVALAICTLLASATIGWFYVPALAAALAFILVSSESRGTPKIRCSPPASLEVGCHSNGDQWAL